MNINNSPHQRTAGGRYFAKDNSSLQLPSH